MTNSETNKITGVINTTLSIARDPLNISLYASIIIVIGILSPDLYLIPLNFFMLSTQLIGFHIIQFCQAQSALLVGGLATGIVVYASNKILKKKLKKEY